MSTLAERIQSRMNDLGLTQDQLAKLADISQTAVHKLITGKSRETRKLTQLARALRVDVNWLSTGQDSRSAEPTRPDPSAWANVEPGPDIRGSVPLISWVQAGEWCGVVDNFAPGDADEWRETTAKVGKHAYALRVKGDSMTNPHGAPSIPEGCIIIVDPEAHYGNGIRFRRTQYLFLMAVLPSLLGLIYFLPTGLALAISTMAIMIIAAIIVNGRDRDNDSEMLVALIEKILSRLEK